MKKKYLILYFHFNQLKNASNFSFYMDTCCMVNKIPSTLIHKNLKPVLLNKIREIGREKGYSLDYTNCVEDHVHCLIYLKPSQSLSNVIKSLKGTSSHWINEERLSEEYFKWQDGYSAFSVSSFMLEKVRAYIKNQEEHHKTVQYEKELEDLIS